MELENKLKLDYEQTTKYFHEMTNVRFRLLAFLPLVTGTAVGLLQSQELKLVIPLSIFGIMYYEIRNSQIYNALQLRAKALETRMRFESVNGRFQYGGAFLDRPIRNLRFLGILMWHDRGPAIIYAAAFAAWFYLLTGSLIQLGQVQVIKVEVPLVVFVVVVLQLQSLDVATDVLGALPEHLRRELSRESSSRVEERGLRQVWSLARPRLHVCRSHEAKTARSGAATF